MMAINPKPRPFAADYTYTVEGNVIAIVDLDLGNRSVTNDTEYILTNIRSEIGNLAGFSVIYRDSLGRYTVGAIDALLERLADVPTPDGGRSTPSGTRSFLPPIKR